MRVSVIQMSPTHVVGDNIAAVRELVAGACAAEQPDIVVLPEVWSCLGGDANTKRQAAEKLPGHGHHQEGPLYSFLREIARSHQVAVHGGSIGELVGDRLYNTTLVFDRDGVELARYRKIHLFDIVTPGGERYCESDLYRPGREITTFSLAGTVVGCVICYDLRFGYLFDALRDAGAELILLPAAFTEETGKAHWEIMVRARAIETQSWIAASATTGQFVDGEGKRRSTYGHSMICDPWGRVVAQASREPGWATATIDHAMTERVRRMMPVWQHRTVLRHADRVVSRA